jgi:hypothetical protein
VHFYEICLLCGSHHQQPLKSFATGCGTDTLLKHATQFLELSWAAKSQLYSSLLPARSKTCKPLLFIVVNPRISRVLNNTESKVHRLRHINLARAIARGTVVWSMSDSCGKSLNSALVRNLTPSLTTTKIGLIDYVGNSNKWTNFHCYRLNKSAPLTREI